MRRSFRWIFAATLGFAVVARAQDPAVPVETAESVAARVVEFVRDGKTAELAAVAAKDKPDPWDVADALCGRAAFDAADEFARAAPRVAVEALPGYVASARRFPKAGDGRKRLAEATSLLDGGHADEALAKLDEASSPAAAELPLVPALRLRRVRGLALDKLTRHADALVALQSAADDAENAGWLTFAVRCRIDAAQSMQAAGDLAATQAEWARIVVLRERLGDRAGVGRALSNVGSFASLRGDYRGAMALYERSGAVFEGLGDKPEFRAMAGQVHFNRGLVAEWLGNFAEAFVSLERARDLQRAAGDRSGLAGTLTALGELHREMSELDQAVECLREAVRIAGEAGDDRESAAASLVFGAALCAAGRLDEARAALERARELYRTLDAGAARAGIIDTYLARVARKQGNVADAVRLATAGERTVSTSSDRTLVLQARYELGVCCLAASDPATALGLLDAVAAEADAAGLPMHAFHAIRAAAAAQLALGRPREAVQGALRALESLRNLPGGLAATQLTDLRDSSGSGFDEVEIGTRAAAMLGDEEALCVFLEHGRAAAVLESIARTDAERLRDATVARELRFREAALRENEAATLHRLEEARATGDLAAIRERRVAVERARAAVAEIVERIHVESRPAASVLYPEPVGLARIRGALRPGDALGSFMTAGDETLVLVTTAASARIANLGSTASLGDACRALDASRPGGASFDAVRALRRRVIEPLALGDGVRRLLVVPDGRLTSVPFALLAPELEVAYVPSGTTYVSLAPQRDVRGDEVLAFGDPDLGGAQLAALPSARDEARAVGDRVLLGADATEAALRKLLDESAAATPPKRRRAIHFACHGLVDESKPWMSALVLAAGGGHDGRLTALDVVELPFAADLVVLSACDTARGKVLRGDGVVGLPRAFLAGGAPRVLVSLWKVDDAATAALMKRFYELWKGGGTSASAALRQAQAAVRSEKRWEDPAYWAAWQLWGLAD